jgi:alpha-glucosidase (family GH31 glycosyl hydrolase)
VLAVFNSGAAARTLTLPAGTWIDAVSGQSLSGSMSVAAYGWHYLRH